MNKLHISPAVQRDLMEIRERISDDLGNPIAARNMLKRITAAMRSLQDFAQIGTPLRSIADVDSDYRYLLSDSYLIFYRAVGRDVYVDRVLDGRSNYLRVLLEQSQTS